MPSDEVPIGTRFFDWTTTGPTFLKSKTRYVPVICACGFASTVQVYGLRNGRSQRCRPCSAKLRYVASARTLTCPRCTSIFTSSSPRATVCPTCRPAHQAEVNRNYYRDKGPAYTAALRHRSRGKKYGLTAAEFDRRLQAQNAQCAVCNRDLPDERRQPSLDHDHACCSHVLTTANPACGKCARGFLCDGCNLGTALLTASNCCCASSLTCGIGLTGGGPMRIALRLSALRPKLPAASIQGQPPPGFGTKKPDNQSAAEYYQVSGICGSLCSLVVVLRC
jgi:Recombination endonuclease VII